MVLHLRLFASTAFALSLVASQHAFSLDDPLEQSSPYLQTTIQNVAISKPDIFVKKKYTYLRKQNNIRKVARKVSRLLKDEINLVKPEEIAVVLDVDGTLTDHSQPGKHPVKPRYDSTDVVCKLINQHVNVVISSAWNIFDETLGRLTALGLAKDLGIMDPSQTKFGTFNVNGTFFDYIYLGKVVSVRKHPCLDDIYYRQKALAPYVLGFGTNIKKVIFADDSGSNIQIFKEDIKKYKLYPKADHVSIVGLTFIDGMKMKEIRKGKKKKLKHDTKAKPQHATDQLIIEPKTREKLVRQMTPYSKMPKMIDLRESVAEEASNVRKIAKFFETSESSLPKIHLKKTLITGANVKELRLKFEQKQ
jgi:hypothetical protein